ncbi:MAG: hypothetical protein J7M38_11840 [Armatimonadetes bacterium]|nr:hypothetical protein [Armatimonadota bacterium]
MTDERDEQLRLPMQLPDAQRRRRSSRRSGRTRPVKHEQRELMSPPLVQTCGLCGHRQTIFEDAQVCEQCGGVIVRGDPEEEEW